MVCPTTAFAAWDSTNSCVVLSFIEVGGGGAGQTEVVGKGARESA